MGNLAKDIISGKGGVILEATLNVGDTAPDFSLPATTTDPLTLSDYRGKKNVVVAFYGMDFTPG
jgi:peroxiredoxin